MKQEWGNRFASVMAGGNTLDEQHMALQAHCASVNGIGLALDDSLTVDAHRST